MRPVICFALTIGISTIAAVTRSAERGPETRLLWDCDDTAGIAGLALERSTVKQGAAAVRWRDHTRTPSFSVPNVPRDWSRFNLLRLWLHNAKPLAARFMIIVPSENPASEGEDYWGYGVRLDFEGWKEIVLPLGGRGGTRSPRGWDQVDGLRFTAAGWGNEPQAEADVVIDDLRLEYAPPRPGPRMTDVQFFEQLDLQRDDLAAVRQAVQSGDLEAAKKAFLEHLRARTAPRWWFDWRERPNQARPLEGGSEHAAHSAKATGDVITRTDAPDVTGAERVLAHLHDGFPLGDDIDWEANKRAPGDPAFTREWTYDLNRFGQWRTLGRAYWQTGDEKYAREWIAQMRDWIEDNPYLLFGTGNDTLTWRTIEAGIRCSSSWPDALYSFLGSPSLTPDDLVVFMKSWIEHAHHLMRITVEHPEHGGNWVTMECNGLGHLGILFPECREAPLWLETAVNRLTLELDRQVYPDGAQKELTTGYHQVALRNFVGLYKLANRNGIALPAAYLQRLERMYAYNLQAMTPEGCLPPLNDAGYTDVNASLREAAELFGRDEFRWAATGGAAGTPPDYTSRGFPYAGQYVMRSGWATDDRYLLFESGPFGIGHQHEDQLTMFIYGLGRVLLTEAGTYSYDASDYRRYVLGTWAHNTILVDGQQQHRRDLPETYQTETPLDNLWVSNDVFDAADGVYRSGYGPKREIDVRHERTVVFVRPDYWVVVDVLQAQGKHTYDVLWHLNNDQAGQDAKTLAAWGADPSGANLLVTPSPASGLTLEIVRGRENPVLGFAPASRRKPIPVLDYRLAADGPLTLAWALTPYRGQRPEVSVATENRHGGTVVTVTHSQGRDSVFVARRGETGSVSLAGRDLRGRVAVVRSDEAGTIVAARGAP